MIHFRNLLLSAVFLLLGSGAARAQSYLAFDDKPAGLVLAAAGKALPLLVSPEDHKGVVRAATDLQHDFGLATGTQPELVQQPKLLKGNTVLIIGTIGKSRQALRRGRCWKTTGARPRALRWCRAPRPGR